MASRPDLRHIDAWLFDLDNTLYPASCGLLDLVSERITRLIMRTGGLDWDDARTVQRGWYEAHGASLPGMLAAYAIDPTEFLADVHDVPLDCVQPDPVLDAALDRLPGRRLVFTNGSARHAERVLERLGVAARFEAVFHVEAAELVMKPAEDAYARMLAAFAVEPVRTCFFEDTVRNLLPAHGLGMTTVLVGDHAATEPGDWVDHRTAELASFLQAALVQEPA